MKEIYNRYKQDLEKIDDMSDSILPIVVDTVKNHITLEEACKRAGGIISPAEVTRIMEQSETDKLEARNQLFSEMKKLLSVLYEEVKVLKEQN